MEDKVFEFLGNMGGFVPSAMAWLGALVVFLRVVVKLTPTGKDDAFLKKIDKLPLVGSFLSGVASRAPIKKR